MVARYRAKFHSRDSVGAPRSRAQTPSRGIVFRRDCFRRGHRLMVQVQSSWFPLVDRNPQTFVNIPTAKAEDFHKATQRVYRTANAPSALAVLVLPGPKE